jgi:sugar/nucleoside kinase (ribokinase family)
MGLIYGIGNPLMDVICRVGFDRFKKMDAVPGSMNLVDQPIYSKISDILEGCYRSAGGSSANTLRGIAWLDNSAKKKERPIFTGGIGGDTVGDEFAAKLEELGVQSNMVEKSLPSGVSCILVTPDYERTMFTYLGACRELNPQDLSVEAIESCCYLHITGYMWDTPNQEETAKKAVEMAMKNEIPVSFDIADPFVVERYRKKILDWISGKIHVLFANREELRALTLNTGSDDDVLHAASHMASIVVMKIGEKGCKIYQNGIINVPGEKVRPKDTTGAGDSFAAGFLYALLKGKDAAICGKMGNRLASCIVQVEGCNYENFDREDVLSCID